MLAKIKLKHHDTAMKLVIASNNAHKIREFQEIMPEHIILKPKDLGIEFEHDEIETSFALNAVGKATSLWRQLLQSPKASADLLVVADDSGLVVPALGGAPGVYSARYGAIAGADPLSDSDRNALLLRNMQGIIDRQAYYVCSMALVHGLDKFDIIQETWDGSIANEASQAKGGFGYDPLFYLAEFACTVADLPPQAKSTLSHRAKAMLRLLRLLKA